MKNQITFLLVFFVSFSANAQIDSMLNNYKFRFQRYQGFGLNGQLGSNGTISPTNRKLVYPDTTISRANTQNHHSQSLNIAPFYFSNTSSAHLQQRTSININERLKYNSEKFKNENTHNHVSDYRIENQIFINHERRNYKRKKFNYFKGNFSYYGYLESDKRLDQDTLSYHNKQKSHDNSISFSAGFGSGRLEVVTDLVQAYFILEDLEKRSGVKAKKRQVIALAEGITGIRNRRYLDYRLRYKSQMEAIDSVLIKSGIVEQTDLEYFNIISDNWLYARRDQRISGNRWTHRLVLASDLDFSFRNDFEDESYAERYRVSKDRNQKTTFKWVTEYDFSKQKSLHVQRSFGGRIELGGNHITRKEKSNRGNEPINEEHLALFNRAQQEVEGLLLLYWEHLYQPNTRNIFTLNISTDFSNVGVLPNSIQPTSDIKRDDIFDCAANLNGYYYHWISPRVNFNISANCSVNSRNYLREYGNEMSDNQYNDWNYNFTAGFVYRWF